MAEAMRAQVNGALPEAITGLSIDSRTIAPGEAYFAIKGDVHDGHDFVAAALKAGAALAVVEAAQRDKFAADAPLLVVDDVLAGLVDLAQRRARAPAGAGDRGHRLGRQDLDQGSAAARARRAGRDPRLGGVVQQSLGRAAVAGALSGTMRFAIFEIGMNHAGEIEPLVGWCGRMSPSSPRSSRCIWNSSPASRRLPTPRRKSLQGVEPGGAVVLNRDNSQFARLQRRARKLGISRSSRSAPTRNPMRGCSTCRCMRPVRRCMPIFSAMTSPTSSACPAVTWR